MTRSFTNRIFGGVCGGIGEAMRINPWLLRLLVICLSVISMGIAAVGYLLLWWLLPQESPIANIRGASIRFILVIGVVILLTGLWIGHQNKWLVTETGQSLLLPLLILITGTALLLKQLRTPLFGGILLLIGGVSLLNNLGTLPEGLSDLLTRAWGGLLVLAGLTWLLRGRIALSHIIAIVMSVIIVSGIAFTAFNNRASQPRDDLQVIIDQPIDDVISLLVVNVNTLNTDVNILPAVERDAGVQGMFIGSTESELVITYDDSAGTTAELTIEETQSNQFPLLEAIGRGTLELEIPPQIAVVVNVINQDGQVTLSLSNLNLELVTLVVETGDAIVTLPNYIPVSLDPEARPSQLTVKNGDIIVFVPEALDAQFALNRGSNRPEFPPSYLLVDDGADGTLQKRGVSEFSMYYEITAPNGLITLATNEE